MQQETKKMKIVFVVLHYCMPEVTKECVRSLLALDGDKEIVVVDNASPDGSGIVLQLYYENESTVHVLPNKKNGGFADGNNLGYSYAKKELKSDIVIVLNNDTLIKDTIFLKKLCSEEIIGDYHIIAPDIVTYKGVHQNPYRLRGITKEEEIRLRKRKYISVIFYSMPLLYKFKSNKGVNRKDSFISKRIDGVVPHGAAVIFMKKWVDNEDFAFYPGTFMYYEEDLLYAYAQSKGYKTLYDPNLKIIHLEDMSTNSTHKNVRKKMLFQNIQKVKSLNVIINFLNGL